MRFRLVGIQCDHRDAQRLEPVDIGQGLDPEAVGDKRGFQPAFVDANHIITDFQLLDGYRPVFFQRFTVRQGLIPGSVQKVFPVFATEKDSPCVSV